MLVAYTREHICKKRSMEAMIEATWLQRLFAVLLAVSVVGSGCRREAGPDRQASQASETGRPGVPLTALVDAATDRPPGQDRLAVLDRLGEPLRVEAVPRKNRHHPTQIDTLRTYRYAGLQFAVYDVTGSAREMMQRISVTDSAYVTEEGVRVGMRREQVRATLGTPDRVTSEAFVYELSPVTPNRLRIVFEARRATRLEWNFYVD